ncbi:hypothetical protein [Cellulomonas cellasea]|uniref:Phosphoribosyltransferase domain-containing protein n=2 Tax=Cellulomonas cellasea TaxID=43670 RepID=A0A0A0B681_9CELL|nr:hypothetical protein [Cellulomonas cellasea]KGM01319.1 hypothetical protein Q760_02190 [Cellulomonas cellasea DSM 20118]GEA87386.1 hypothetical protein CCE01nite_13350 [Cellulomonas cellasea]
MNPVTGARARCSGSPAKTRARGLRVGHTPSGEQVTRASPRRRAGGAAWLQARTPPDHHDKQLDLGIRRDLVGSADRVLLVDDWVATGGQALGARALVEQADATWLGLAVLVDGLTEPAVRRRLGVRSLLHIREL